MMNKVKRQQAWAAATAVALSLLLFAACTGDSTSYPTQPAARNVTPGIETGALTAAFDCEQDDQRLFTIVCQDLSTGAVESWSWDFGDGGTSTARNPTHSYGAPGLYVVVLTVSHSNGSSTASELEEVDPPEEGG